MYLLISIHYIADRRNWKGHFWANPIKMTEMKSVMEKLIQGVSEFKKKDFEERKKLFKSLATGQSPEVLFITCSDSRIDPGMLTQTEPGDLFICRNAGNIVPPHTEHTGGMTASIEYEDNWRAK